MKWAAWSLGRVNPPLVYVSGRDSKQTGRPLGVLPSPAWSPRTHNQPPSRSPAHTEHSPVNYPFTRFNNSFSHQDVCNLHILLFYSTKLFDSWESKLPHLDQVKKKKDSVHKKQMIQQLNYQTRVTCFLHNVLSFQPVLHGEWCIWATKSSRKSWAAADRRLCL